MRSRLAGLVTWIRQRPLGAALLLALALRLTGIQSRALQYDDAFSIFISVRSLPEIVAGTAADTMPPLYYFLLHYWLRLGQVFWPALAGQEIWFMRLLSVLISLALVALLYFTVERWAGRGAAGWAAVLAAISPLQIYHAQDIRMYALLVLGQAGYAWCFTRAWFAEQEGRPGWGSWAGLVLFGLVAAYSHNLAIFALVVPDLFLLLKKRWKMLGKLIAAQAVIGLGALPWWLLLPGQLQKIQHAFWTPRPGLAEIIQAIIMFTASLPLPPVLMVIAAVLSLQILVMVALELWRSGRGDAGVVFLGGLLLVPPALLFAVSYLMRPVFVPRGFLVSSLAYYGLAGFAIARAWSRGAGKVIAAAFLLAAALTLPSFYTFNEFPRSPYREAAAYLEQAKSTGSVIVHDTKLSFFPMRVYAPALPQVFIADPPGTANDTFALASQQAMQIFPQPDLAAATAGKQAVYFITYTRVFQEYQDLGLDEHPGIQWLAQHYRLVGRKVFNDLEIYQYER